MAGNTGADPATRERARSVLHDAAVDGSLRAAAISVVAASATVDEHAELEREPRQAATPQDELRYLNACWPTPRTLPCSPTRSNWPHPRCAPRTCRTCCVGHSSTRPSVQRPGRSSQSMVDPVRTLPLQQPSADARGRPWHHRPGGRHGDRRVPGGHPTPGGDRQIEQHLERMWVTVTATRRCRAALAADASSFDQR